MSKFTCEYCSKSFKHISSLKRHVRLNHQNSSSSMKCLVCDLEFASHKDFLKHNHLIDHNKKKEQSNIYCNNCKKSVTKSIWSLHLRTNEHKKNSVDQLSDGVKCIKSIFKNRIVTYSFENVSKDNLVPEIFLTSIQNKVTNILKEMMQKHDNIKFNFELFCNYMLLKEGNESCTIETKSHQTKMMIISSIASIEDIIQYYLNHCNILIRKMSEFQERDSGWTLTEILHLELNINQYNCIKGSQYIPLPTILLKKQGCVNIQNNDEYCFKWAIISALCPINMHSNRCTSYKVNDITADIIVLENNMVLNFKNLNFPLPVNEIKIFELNNTSISINVFGLENNNIIGPYYFSQEEKSNHINLLLLEDNERFHYVWIKNISRCVV